MASAQLTSRTALNLASRQLQGLHTKLNLPAFQPRLLPAVIIPGAATIFSNLTGLLSSLWDGLLHAVPKNKTSHSRKRSRQLAGKALKDLINLNHCSSCGRMKRMHILCPHCVQSRLLSYDMILQQCLPNRAKISRICGLGGSLSQ